MPDFRQTVYDHLGRFEELVSKIPGYKGYKEKELRREADTLLRDQIARALSAQLSKAEDVTSQMLTGPGLSQLNEMGKGNTRLQTLIDKVKTAAQGYAGFFDAIRIKEDELDALYEFDHEMLLRVDEIGAVVDQVQAAVDGGDEDLLAPAVRVYVKTVTDTSALFDQRRDAITQTA
jgi:hypothetical protein